MGLILHVFSGSRGKGWRVLLGGGEHGVLHCDAWGCWEGLSQIHGWDGRLRFPCSGCGQMGGALVGLLAFGVEAV